MTPDVVFLEPSFPPNQREFVRALHAVGARVTGIGERPKESLDPELRNWLFHYEQIGNVTDVAQVERAVRFVQSKVRVDRLEAVVEAHAVLVDILGQRIHWGKIIRRCQSRAWRRKRTAIKYLPRDRIYAACYLARRWRTFAKRSFELR